MEPAEGADAMHQVGHRQAADRLGNDQDQVPAKAMDFAVLQIQATASDYAMPGAFKDIKIQIASLGETAGIIGGAALVRQLTA
jgi:hypothetical protein